jgi:hypothetical protein
VSNANVIALGGKATFDVVAFGKNRFLVKVNPPPTDIFYDVVTIVSDDDRMLGRFWAIKAPGLAPGIYYAHRIPEISYPREVQPRTTTLSLEDAKHYFENLD